MKPKRDKITITIKTMKRIFAIPAKLPARPLNPNNPATKASIRKITTQLNIIAFSMSLRTVLSSMSMPVARMIDK